MELDEKFKEIDELMEKINKCMEISRTMQETIDNKKKELENELYPFKIEQKKEEIKNIEANKEEFDGMTKPSVVNATKSIIEQRKNSEKKLIEKLIDCENRKKRIQTRLESFLKRENIDKDTKMKAKKSAQMSIKKIENEEKELTKAQKDVRTKLDNYENKISEYSVELGIEKEVNNARTEKIKELDNEGENAQVEQTRLESAKKHFENIKNIINNGNKGEQVIPKEEPPQAVQEDSPIEESSNPESKVKATGDKVKATGDEVKATGDEVKATRDEVKETGDEETELGDKGQATPDERLKYNKGNFSIKYDAYRDAYRVSDGDRTPQLIPRKNAEELDDTIKELAKKYEMETYDMEKMDKNILSILKDNKTCIQEYLSMFAKDRTARKVDDESKLKISYDLKTLYAKKGYARGAFSKETIKEILNIANNAKDKKVADVKKGAIVYCLEKRDQIFDFLKSKAQKFLQLRTERKEQDIAGKKGMEDQTLDTSEENTPFRDALHFEVEPTRKEQNKDSDDQILDRLGKFCVRNTHFEDEYKAGQKTKGSNDEFEGHSR